MAPQGPNNGPAFIIPRPSTTEDDDSSYLTESDDDTGSTSSSQRRRLVRKKQTVRITSCIFATIAALCAGSLVVFSLYAPKLQSRLKYTQFQVNGVAIGSSLALYLPVCVLGYVCDRYGAQPLMGLAGAMFALGYGLAAWIYQKLDNEYRNMGKKTRSSDWSFPLMIFAFVCIGIGTCAMYISTVSTCAKNFGKGKYRGLMMAMPITGFGLSGMWLSQFGSHFLYEVNPDGSRGDVDVYRFFLFLAILLPIIGVIGTFVMKVVDEQELIEDAIEEMENSGFLDGSSLLSRPSSTQRILADPATPIRELTEEDALLGGSKIDDDRWKKNWVLNAETRRFLSDHTMWPFALGFLLMIGPGEAFVNNLGTVIGTLTPPGVGNGTSAATHVSVFGITSTCARLLIGTLTDLLAPSPESSHVQLRASNLPFRRFSISRVVFMIFFGFFLAFGFMFLASGAAQNHADRFWVVSGFVGAGYGATFSLAPLIVTIIWGVENFATNFGIIAILPAVGSTFWGLVYSAGYQAGAQKTRFAEDDDDLFCYGKQCYSTTFWAEGITVLLGCGLLIWAWKGKGGWQARKIAI